MLKVEFFRATVETVLLYGSSGWTLTVALSKKLGGAYTKMLRAAQNIKWQQRITNANLYSDVMKITTTTEERRLRFSGHCWLSKQEVIHKVILWDPPHGKRSCGRPARTYIDKLTEDTNLSKDCQMLWKIVNYGEVL